MFPVNEIFYSLQGEGYHTGTAAVFVRFSGCNLACDFCDTDHRAHVMMTIDEIVNTVKKYQAPTVILTGGEPTLQSLEGLVDALHSAGRRVHIETNGTRLVAASIDWVTCSPKPDGKLAIDHSDELKIVYQGQNVEAIRESVTAPHNYLQPCSGKNTQEVIAYILDHPHWKLSLQTHKLLDIR